MATPSPDHLSARKKPRQARSRATLDVIFEATLQVLIAHGPRRTTTTRVAERAGVSVGTMYQYFPHKQALFYAVNERYLDILAERVEAACREQHGDSIKHMIDVLVTTYWKAKTERPEMTRALYRSVAEIDNEPLIQAFSQRIDAATAAMLASASDAHFTDLPTVNLTLLSTVFGTVRSVFEHRLPDAKTDAVLRQLMVMCTTYLETVSTASSAPASATPSSE
ncbi:MAG TPA: TetR/AcrR family transcriptional regulator [Oleiagrimonas sp.]|nr:TetR/AcrR family transcriptional regulator [Oleiagrimonas sp.]